MTRPWTPTLSVSTPFCTRHSRAVWPRESWYFRSPAVASEPLAEMLRVEVPPRMSTPGQSMSGCDSLGDLGWVTPGLALANMLENRLLNDGDVDADGSASPPPMPRDEQPDSAAAPSNSTTARR